MTKNSEGMLEMSRSGKNRPIPPTNVWNEECSSGHILEDRRVWERERDKAGWPSEYHRVSGSLRFREYLSVTGWKNVCLCETEKVIDDGRWDKKVRQLVSLITTEAALI